jgi:hypothetical protein
MMCIFLIETYFLWVCTLNKLLALSFYEIFLCGHIWANQMNDDLAEVNDLFVPVHYGLLTQVWNQMNDDLVEVNDPFVPVHYMVYSLKCDIASTSSNNRKDDF